jgi:GDPmannose 4,6-dehydratase
MIKEMIDSDYAAAQRDHLVKQAGFQAYNYHE